MLEGIFLGEKYRVWLDDLKKKSNRALDTSKTECQKCGFCCATRPCIPTPDELKRIANFLKISLKDTVKTYFVADSTDNVNKFIFPAKETQLDITGTYIDYRRTYDEGYCCFFDKEQKICKINSVKPQSAKDMKCWEKETDEGNKKAISSWKGINITDFGIDISSDDFYDDE